MARLLGFDILSEAILAHSNRKYVHSTSAVSSSQVGHSANPGENRRLSCHQLRWRQLQQLRVFSLRQVRIMRLELSTVDENVGGPDMDSLAAHALMRRKWWAELGQACRATRGRQLEEFADVNFVERAQTARRNGEERAKAGSGILDEVFTAHRASCHRC